MLVNVLVRNLNGRDQSNISQILSRPAKSEAQQQSTPNVTEFITNSSRIFPSKGREKCYKKSIKGFKIHTPIPIYGQHWKEVTLSLISRHTTQISSWETSLTSRKTYALLLFLFMHMKVHFEKTFQAS